MDAGIRSLDLAWKVTDIHDKVVAEGKNIVELNAAGDRAATVRPVTIRTPGSGYFRRSSS